MKTEEFSELANVLERHHSIFGKLWNLGRPIFTKDIPTAAVRFDRIGECVEFIINDDFWKDLSLTQKQFVISHECLHVVLYHGFRINKLTDSELGTANIALDLVVNHSLIDSFGFTRTEVDPKDKYYWLDKYLPKENPGNLFEHYYNLLKQKHKKLKSELVDDHSGLGGFGFDFSDFLDKNLSQEEKQSISDLIKNNTKDIEKDLESAAKTAGVSPGNLWHFVKIDKIIQKKKWETVIKRWARLQLKEKDNEQWIRPDRRLQFMPKNFFIPSEQIVEDLAENKILVWFFQDTSGSCWHLKDRFFKAALSLPKDKFDVKMCCFDTKVIETNLESKKIYGGGGTSFSCIENYIQSYISKNKLNYPKAIFIISDGMGNSVKPQKPENWYWFLSVNCIRHIPKKSKFYNLSDFE